ncbi:MAG: flagellin [Anaerolineaceae bacterium]
MVTQLDAKSRQFIDGLKQIQLRSQRAQQQITSGRRVNKPSDDPGSIPEILGLQGNLQHVQQTRTGLQRVQTELQTADTALQQATSLMDRAATLGAQANSDILDSDKRKTLAQEVRQVQDSLLALSQTNVNGRYIFSGDSDQIAQYQANPASPTGVWQVQTVTATRQVAGLDKQTFSVDRTASEIFDARQADGAVAGSNAFAAIQRLATALETNDMAALPDILQKVREAGTHINQELSHYGVSENRVTEQLDFAQKVELQFTARLSEVRDTDTTQAILDLTQSGQHLQAAIAARGQIPRSTLFDILG